MDLGSCERPLTVPGTALMVGNLLCKETVKESATSGTAGKRSCSWSAFSTRLQCEMSSCWSAISSRPMLPWQRADQFPGHCPPVSVHTLRQWACWDDKSACCQSLDSDTSSGQTAPQISCTTLCSLQAPGYCSNQNHLSVPQFVQLLVHPCVHLCVGFKIKASPTVRDWQVLRKTDNFFRIHYAGGPRRPPPPQLQLRRSRDLAHASIPLAQTPWGLTGRAWLQAGAQHAVIAVDPSFKSLWIDSRNVLSISCLCQSLHAAAPAVFWGFFAKVWTLSMHLHVLQNHHLLRHCDDFQKLLGSVPND